MIKKSVPDRLRRLDEIRHDRAKLRQGIGRDVPVIEFKDKARMKVSAALHEFRRDSDLFRTVAEALPVILNNAKQSFDGLRNNPVG